MSDRDATPTNVVRLSKKSRGLSDAHREHLRASGLTDESIDAGGFWTERDRAEIAGLLNWRGYPKGRGDVLAIPFYLPGANDAPYMCRVRPDQPRTHKNGKVAKYEQPKDTPMGPYYPVRTRMRQWLADPTRALVFTEGEKKAALLDQLGFATIGSTGVDCWHDKPHRDDTDAYRLHELIRKHATIEGRRCLIAFDSDAADNDHVMRAARVLAWMLEQAGARQVLFVRIPPGEANAKLGIDDYYTRHGEPATRTLLDTALEPIEPLSGDDARSLLTNYRALKDIPLDERLRMPHGYDLSRDGSLIRTEGEQLEVIERAPIFVSRLVADLYSGHEHAELVFRRNRSWRTVLVPRRCIADSRAALAELAPLGAPIDSNTSAKVVRWLRDFESTNDKRLPRATSVSRCGWHRVGGEDIFAAGDVLRPEGSAVELVVDKHQERGRLARALAAHGSLEAHLDVLRRAWEASPVAAVAIAGALAAPLLRPLSAPLFAIHLAGDSSRGKSTMLRLAASIYGNPHDEGLVASWNATTVGHEVRAAYLCDLPLPIDEAGIVDTKEREKAVYMLVNGEGRTRGAKEGGLRETHSWRTVVLSTGERQLVDEDASATGAQVRILQLHVDGFGSLDAAGVDALGRGVIENHGHVGRRWLELLVRTSPETWTQRRAELKAGLRLFQDLSDGEGLRSRQAGFWALLAHVEGVAFDLLGLGRMGGSTMRQLFEGASSTDGVGIHRQVRGAADRAIDLVREWISSHAHAFPRLVTTSTGAKVPKGEGIAREVCGYIDDELGRLYLLPTSLKRFLDERQIDDQVACRGWRDRGWLDSVVDNRFTKPVRIGGKRPRLVSLSGEAVGLESAGEDFGGEGGSGGSSDDVPF